MTLFAPIHILILFISALLPMALLIVAVVLAINVVHRTKRLADERWQLDNQRRELLQKELQEIHHRLTAIEAMLKDRT
jgi:cell division protein FtsL